MKAMLITIAVFAITHAHGQSDTIWMKSGEVLVVDIQYTTDEFIQYNGEPGTSLRANMADVDKFSWDRSTPGNSKEARMLARERDLMLFQFNPGDEIVIQEVVEVDSADKRTLYNRARIFMADLYAKSDFQLELDDPEIGVLVGTGYTDHKRKIFAEQFLGLDDDYY